MKLGVLLPTFRRSPQPALDAAREARAAGLDGVFAYDHLWPMGSPHRPAIAPFEVLAAVAATVPQLSVGTLVARVGLVADDVLVSQFRALSLVAPGRVIAGLGTGDHLSLGENLAYGIEVADPGARRARLAAIAATLLGDGEEVWVGAGAAATRQIAADVGATLNLFGATPREVARAAASSAVSWAGEPPVDGDGAAALAALLADLADAGATWAVLRPGTPAATLAAAAGRA